MAGVIPDEPPVADPEPRRHLVCQYPCPNSPQNALGTSRRDQFRQGIEHTSKRDPDPNAPQHLRGGMVAKSIPWSKKNGRRQLPRVISCQWEEGRPTWNRPLHRPMRPRR